jgi:hypothetical protein
MFFCHALSRLNAISVCRHVCVAASAQLRVHCARQGHLLSRGAWYCFQILISFVSRTCWLSCLVIVFAERTSDRTYTGIDQVPASLPLPLLALPIAV